MVESNRGLAPLYERLGSMYDMLLKLNTKQTVVLSDTQKSPCAIPGCNETRMPAKEGGKRFVPYPYCRFHYLQKMNESKQRIKERKRAAEAYKEALSRDHN